MSQRGVVTGRLEASWDLVSQEIVQRQRCGTLELDLRDEQGFVVRKRLSVSMCKH